MSEQLTELRTAIDGLRLEMAHHEFSERKREMLALIDGAIELCQSTQQPQERLHERLSPRENEVMKMLLSGNRLKEIASQLNISVKTVTTHRARLLRKLRLEDNLGLYRYAVRNGLIRA